MILSLLLAGMGTAATAQNINLPIIQTKYTADPAPYVHNDTVYLAKCNCPHIHFY